MATIKAQQLYAYQDQSDGQRTIVATGADGSGVLSLSNAVLYWDINGNPVLIFTPSTGATNPRMASSRDFAFFADGISGDLYKWHVKNGLSKWGPTAPVVAPTVGAPIGAGSITLTTGRKYAVAFYNATTQSYSDFSPISVSSGPLSRQNVPLSGIPVSSDPQITNKLIVATADGGDPTTLYQVTTIANATTTYTDSTTEITLTSGTIWQETDSTGIQHGLLGNQPPPNGSFPIYHNGRIFLAVGEILFFSKSLAEVTTSSGIIAGRYEEAFVPDNSLSISTGAEQIHGLLSDGQTLYIGTELHIRRLLGDGPENFSQPETVFPQTGLLNQNVWQLVYVEGTPVGTMWMTPDFRVMASDFNTYTNVGTPINPILATINQSALNSCWAAMVSNGPYNFYMLAIPTGTNTVADTFCVYDMRLRQWYVWQFADQFLSGMFYVSLSGTPRWVFCDASGNLRLIDPTATYDRQGDATQTAITSTVQTTWLNLGDPNVRKALNQLEIETVDPALTVTVEGASTNADFKTPHTVVTNAPLVTSALGPYIVPVAGYAAIDRHYRFTINSTSGQTSTPSDVILGFFSADLVPIHRI